jgi:hypothetical protein
MAAITAAAWPAESAVATAGPPKTPAVVLRYFQAQPRDNAGPSAHWDDFSARWDQCRFDVVLSRLSGSPKGVPVCSLQPACERAGVDTPMVTDPIARQFPVADR